MDTEELKILIVQLAAVAERLDQRSESAVQRVEQTGAWLSRSAQQLGSSTGDFTREVSQALQQESADIIGRGLGGAVERFNHQLDGAIRNASSAAHVLEEQRMALNRERKTWVWLGSGALLVGSLLAIGAAGYAVTQSRGEVSRNRVEANLLQAYNQADVILCEGRLCANVDDTGQRYGDRKQYRPVDFRSTHRAR